MVRLFSYEATKRFTAHTLRTSSRVVGLLAAVVLVVTAGGVFAPQPAQAASTAYRVEARLQYLGYPTGTVDGVITTRTRQALCA